MKFPNLKVEGRVKNRAAEPEPPTSEFGGLVVGTAETGPFGAPLLIQNQEQFRNTYGDPEYSSATWTAYEALRFSDDVRFARAEEVFTKPKIVDFSTEDGVAFQIFTTGPALKAAAEPFIIDSVKVSTDPSSPYFFDNNAHPGFSDYIGLWRKFEVPNPAAKDLNVQVRNPSFVVGDVGSTPWIIDQSGNRLFKIHARREFDESLVLKPGFEVSSPFFSFQDLSTDPKSPNFVGKRIGNEKWEKTTTGFKKVGSYEATNPWIRVEIAKGAPATEPAGFEDLKLDRSPSKPVLQQSQPKFEYTVNPEGVDLVDGAKYGGETLGYVSNGTYRRPVPTGAAEVGSYGGGLPMRVPIQRRSLSNSDVPASINEDSVVKALSWSLEALGDVQIFAVPELNADDNRDSVFQLQRLARLNQTLYVLDAYDFETEPEPNLAGLPIYLNGFATSYYGWVKDESGTPRPPSSIAFATMAANEQTMAPAGVPQGLVPSPVKPYKLWKPKDLEKLERMNGIYDTSTGGLALWGNKTLDPGTRLSDRKAVIRIRTLSAKRLRKALFELNTDENAEFAKEEVEKVADRFQSSGIIENYDVSVSTLESNLDVSLSLSFFGNATSITINFTVSLAS